MLSVEEALELVAKNAIPLAPRRVPLAEAAGLLLAEDVVTEVDSPPYSKSMMDGYAVRSVDRDPLRQVLAEVAAGDVPRHPVTPGAAVRIMTGAPIPDGADAVVPLEQTDRVDDSVVRLLQVDPPHGQNILPVGSSLRAGDTVLNSGAHVRPIEIAILAEIGRAFVNVQPRPRVAILPTGNEIVAVGEKPVHGQIRNSNGPMLQAAAVRAGAEAIELRIARDEREQLKHLIEQGLAADMLVLSGGVSAGAFDLVPGVLEDLGVEQVFHKIALRPGKPLWFGVKDDGEHRVLVFGLPGNPVSSLVCFELFARPSIAAMSGRGFVGAPTVHADLIHDFTHGGGRAACLPARVTAPSVSASEMDATCHRDSASPPAEMPAAATVEILSWQGSADIATLGRANGLARLPNQQLHLAEGTQIDVLLI
jgi:molybdopterin molybdotransferase